MEEAFDRVYSLTIGRNNALVEKTIPQLLVQPAAGVPQLLANPSYSDFNSKPNNALVITELRIKANVQYTKDSGTNKQGTIIEIYNLTQDNQRRIFAEDTVLLRAGYRSIDGDNPPLIFTGQVKSVSTTKVGQDTITKLICTAIDVPRKNIRFSKTPVRGETNEDVANYFASVAAANGIATGYVFVPDIVTYPSGYAAGGNLFDAMAKFCENFNLRAYVVLNRLYIEPIAVSAPAVAKVIVNEVNVKGNIRAEDDSTGLTSSDPAKAAGISLNTFLNGNITPAKLLNVSFGDYRGDYTISSVSHVLDLEGKDWDTIISAKRST